MYCGSTPSVAQHCFTTYQNQFKPVSKICTIDMFELFSSEITPYIPIRYTTVLQLYKNSLNQSVKCKTDIL